MRDVNKAMALSKSQNLLKTNQKDIGLEILFGKNSHFAQKSEMKSSNYKLTEMFGVGAGTISKVKLGFCPSES